jgi:dihydrofolate reductase
VARKLIFSMSTSLDGFIAGPGDTIDWSVPDEELHRFHNDRVRELGAHLCGRRLYETMTFWDTVDDADLSPAGVEFRPIWTALPKIVFSTTLDQVGENATLLRGGVAEEVERLKAQPGKDLGVGGAGLAAACIERGLVDEFDVFINPVVLGGGTPFFPALAERVALELVETRTFSSRVVYARYRLAPAQTA